MFRNKILRTFQNFFRSLCTFLEFLSVMFMVMRYVMNKNREKSEKRLWTCTCSPLSGFARKINTKSTRVRVEFVPPLYYDKYLIVYRVLRFVFWNASNLKKKSTQLLRNVCAFLRIVTIERGTPPGCANAKRLLCVCVCAQFTTERARAD